MDAKFSWVRTVPSVFISWAVVIPEQFLVGWSSPRWALQLGRRQPRRWGLAAEEGKPGKWRGPQTLPSTLRARSGGAGFPV